MIPEETILVNDPLFSEEAVDQLLIRNQANKIIPRKPSMPLPSFGLMQGFHGKDSEGKNQTLGQQKAMLWLLLTYDQ